MPRPLQSYYGLLVIVAFVAGATPLCFNARPFAHYWTLRRTLPTRLVSECCKAATALPGQTCAKFPHRLAETSLFIVQGKPREAAGIVKVIKETRTDALRAAQDLLDGDMPFVTIIGDGLVYSIEEFALTIINNRPD
jgi:hypothetical protein